MESFLEILHKQVLTAAAGGKITGPYGELLHGAADCWGPDRRWGGNAVNESLLTLRLVGEGVSVSELYDSFLRKIDICLFSQACR